MNMSHVISHLSFGRKLSPRVMSDIKRLIPYLGRSHDRLNGRAFINQRDLGANVTVSLWPQLILGCLFSFITFCIVDHEPSIVLLCYLVEEYIFMMHQRVDMYGLQDLVSLQTGLIFCLLNLQIEHYLQIVKTEVMTRSSRDQPLVEEYEYTAHSSLAQSLHIPVAKFHFELSPMQVY